MMQRIEHDHAPLPRDRPRQDQAEPAQVHLHGRADRQEGQGPRLDPAAADRHPALPLRRASSRAASARARASRAAARRRATERGRRARPATAPGEHILEVDVTLDELAADPRRGARAAAHRAARARSSIVDAAGPVHRHRARRAPSRCATSSAPTSEALQAPDRVGHVRPGEPDHRPDPRGQALPLAGRKRADAARPTPSSST